MCRGFACVQCELVLAFIGNPSHLVEAVGSLNAIIEQVNDNKIWSKVSKEYDHARGDVLGTAPGQAATGGGAVQGAAASQGGTPTGTNQAR